MKSSEGPSWLGAVQILNDLMEGVKKHKGAYWFEEFRETFPFHHTVEGNGENPFWLGDPTGGYVWRVSKDGDLTINPKLWKEMPEARFLAIEAETEE